ncbi:MAG TPA: ABC transporter permease [Candidatus Limnocylindria bacterium]|nr:ABC transporter permease [Candidatus Limnocylindria bacterium]
MNDTALRAATKGGVARPRARTSASWWHRLERLLLPAYTHLVLLWLFAPIAVMTIYGFNDTHGRLNIVWSGFTLKWFADPFGVTALTNAVYTSLLSSTIGAAISTVLGTMIALASHRYHFRGRTLLDAVMVMNIAASEVVMGAALLTLFLAANVPLGFLTIVLAQVMFSIPFVAITVRARLVGFDNSLEEAAQDLGASPLTTFTLVTLPIIFPGVLAAALLAFALCLDDYVITSFVSGTTQTFPLWVYGATRLGVPPQVNVIGTFIFLAGALLSISFAVIRSWRNRQLARESAL